MRQKILRDMPDEIEMIARNEASRQGVSLNKAFLSLLRKSTNKNAAQSSAADMKRGSRFPRFSGVWSKTEADEFNKVLLELRAIDEETWR